MDLSPRQAAALRAWATERSAIEVAWADGARVVVRADRAPVDEWERRAWEFDLAKAIHDDGVSVVVGEGQGREVYRRGRDG